MFRLSLALVAAGKVVVSLVALIAGPDLTPPISPPALVLVLVAVTFGGIGLMLVAGGRDDLRTQGLGLYLLLVASPFVDSLAAAGPAAPDQRNPGK